VSNPTYEALARATRSAVHLEMRDSYMPNDPVYRQWREGMRYGPDDRPDWYSPWAAAVSGAVGRGVTVRRARIVSEPVTDYIKYEHHVTFLNLAAGEDVRWLPRAKATGIALPGNDFWLFDDETAVINHFTGIGEGAGREVVSDPAVLRLLGSSFEAVWDVAAPHQEYKPE